MESDTTTADAVPLEIALRAPDTSSGLSRPRGRRLVPAVGEDGVGRQSPPLPLMVDATEAVGRVMAVSRAMNEVFTLVGRLAAASVTVTLIGETGTGKDVLAQLIHERGPRANQPFVVFDCGAVPPNLVESELFGHERGAFTGAHAEHEGAFERADGGTLFLDEIGELPLELQPRLLRVLDNRVVRRVGIAIRQTVGQAGGNKVHAARTLGIAPSTLYEKLRKYGL